MLTLKPQESHFFSKQERDSNSSSRADIQLICEPLADYTKESERLNSYINWPNTEVSPITLTKAGFYYLGISDIVRCAFCGTEGYKWVTTDNPMEDHKQWKPSCSFVRRTQRTENNGNSQQPETSSSSASGQDTCGKECIEIFPKSVADDELVTLEKYGANKTKGPRHREYITIESRLKSFADWPKSMRQKPADLAEAGFFYRGTGDQTLCYHCGGGLNDWVETDEPWEQHAMWFPKCNYLLMKKGQEFVDTVKQEALTAEVPSTSSSSHQAKELEKSECVKQEEEVKLTENAKSKVDQLSEDESKKIPDSRICKICFKNEMGVLFLPCGHIVACVDCATALSNCAVCRKQVEATVRAFLS